MAFATWADGFREWMRRMTDPSYRGGVHVNPDRAMTLEALVATYVGGPLCWTTRGRQCANGETWSPENGSGSIDRYLAQTVDRINEHRGRSAQGSSPPTPGETRPEPDPEPRALAFGNVRQLPFADRLVQDRLNWSPGTTTRSQPDTARPRHMGGAGIGSVYAARPVTPRLATGPRG